jgi:nitrate reductase gamma subunit
MFWLSLAVFIAGLFWRAVWYARGLDWQLDRVAYRAWPKEGARGAVRSVFRWLVPFGTRGWRVQPFMTVVFFLFHAGAVLAPVFLLAHNVFLESKLGVSLPALPRFLADALALLAVIAGLLLALRRVALPEVRILTDWRDGLVLALSLAPFITGLLARFQAGDYQFWLLAHIISGEAFLIAAPFTKLSHIVLFFMSRAQLGMDYGIKRGGMKGKGMAW